MEDIQKPQYDSEPLEKAPMKEFEVSYILQAENGSDVIRDFFTRHGCEIIHMDQLRKVALAYPIQKQETGYFGVSWVRCAPFVVRELEKEAQLDKNILRMLVIADPIKMNPVSAREKEFRTEQQTSQAETSATQTNKSDDRAVTNEELEKKLEEILG